MLVFNCTKSAAEFFTVTRQGKKLSCIEPVPHKTIAESIASPVFPDEIDAQENGGYQWQWIVHCVSIKRKKYLLVMDYHSRYCVMFPAGKKGDNIAFLNSFETNLKANFRYWVDNAQMDQSEATKYIEQYDSTVNTCIFHQRSNRSVQAHINEVVWHLQVLCERQGDIIERLDCLLFSVAASKILRKKNSEKEYFKAYKFFFAYWLKTFSPEPHVTVNNIIHFNQSKRN
jgi:hypothetical protein